MFLSMRPWTRKSRLAHARRLRRRHPHLRQRGGQGNLHRRRTRTARESTDGGLIDRGLRLRHRVRLHPPHGHLRPHPARQLPPRPDHRQRLRPPLPDRLQRPRRLLHPSPSTAASRSDVRGEYQHSPSATGYSQALSSHLSNFDLIPYSGGNLNSGHHPHRSHRRAKSLPPGRSHALLSICSDTRSPAASPTPGSDPRRAAPRLVQQRRKHLLLPHQPR